MAEISTAKLDELLAAIKAYDDPRRASSEWKQVYALLQKAGVTLARFQAVVGMRNVTGLAALIDELREPDVAAERAETPDADTLRRAFRTFRKRAKFTRLDDESKLGRGPLSKGSDKSLGAIRPPVEFPEAVWHALVRQGKLRYLGDGLYELADS
jgi:hypothetical protein